MGIFISGSIITLKMNQVWVQGDAVEWRVVETGVKRWCPRQR